jgi:dihydroorotate dehydrogenase electron transfer subunit
MNAPALSIQPELLVDGTLRGVVVAPADEWGRLRLRVPAERSHPLPGLAGRYLLARCAAESGEDRGEDWGIYLRRPLFFCGRYAFGKEEEWCVAVPRPGQDPGHRWLANLAAGATLNVMGPLGNGFQIHPTSRNLLLLADLREDRSWLPRLMPLVEPMLDQGGRVTLLAQTTGAFSSAQLDTLPLALEIRTLSTDDEWQPALAAPIRWADQICAVLPGHQYSELHQAIRASRFTLETGFAQVLVNADLLCGVGGCLACVIPLPGGGLTRACEHGPVFDLREVV